MSDVVDLGECSFKGEHPPHLWPHPGIGGPGLQGYVWGCPGVFEVRKINRIPTVDELQKVIYHDGYDLIKPAAATRVREFLEGLVDNDDETVQGIAAAS